MRVKITKSCKFSFTPSKPICSFVAGEEYLVEEDYAQRLIDAGYAKPVKAIAEKVHVEKLHKVETENKMFSIEDKEDKGMEKQAKSKKGRKAKKKN